MAADRKHWRCGICHEKGHNRRTCPELPRLDYERNVRAFQSVSRKMMNSARCHRSRARSAIIAARCLRQLARELEPPTQEDDR